MGGIRFVLALALATALAGCGLGVHAGHTSGTIPAGTNSLGTPVPGESAAMTSYGFTVYDQTGLMLAALGNAAKVREARRDAVRSAYLRGAKPGDRVNYTVRMDPPTPGLWTSLRFNRGSGDGFDLREIDLQLALGSWHSSIASLGFGIGFQQTRYSRQDRTVGAHLRYDWSGYALPLSMTYRRRIVPLVFVSGSLSLDLLMPAIAGLGGEENKLGYLAAARAEVPLHAMISPYLQLQKRRAPTGGGEQRIDEWSLTAGVTFIYTRGGGSGGASAGPGGATMGSGSSSAAAGTCERAGERLATIMRDGAAPSARSQRLEILLARRCHEDQWSNEARQCISELQRKEDTARCENVLTAEQEQGVLAAIREATGTPP